MILCGVMIGAAALITLSFHGPYPLQRALSRYAFYRIAETIHMMPPGGARLALRQPIPGHMSLPEAISAAWRIDFVVSAAPAAKRSVSFLDTDRQHGSLELRSLRSLSGLHTSLVGTPPDVEVYVFVRSRNVQVFYYSSTTGEIGSDRRWYYVPSGLLQRIRENLQLGSSER